ncbi:MAG: hypothetical protein ACRYFS_06285 [Janthinobacterium lividum]
MAEDLPNMDPNFVDLTKVTIDSAAVNSLPEHVARRYNVLAIKRDNNAVPNRLMVAISASNATTIGMVGMNNIKVFTRCSITWVMTDSASIEDAINRAYSVL